MTTKKRLKLKSDFLVLLQAENTNLTKSVSCKNGDWIVKGFIDIAQNIYTISVDTKVVSKIIELLIFPQLYAFAKK